MHAQCALCIAHSVCVNLCVQQVNHLKLLSQPSPSGWDIEAVAPCPGSLRTPLTPTPPPTLPLPGKKAPWKFNWNLRVAIICRHLKERLIIPRGPPRFASPSIQPSNLHDHMIKTLPEAQRTRVPRLLSLCHLEIENFANIWSLIHCLQILVTKLGLQFWPPGGASCTDWIPGSDKNKVCIGPSHPTHMQIQNYTHTDINNKSTSGFWETSGHYTHSILLYPGSLLYGKMVITETQISIQRSSSY